MIQEISLIALLSMVTLFLFIRIMMTSSSSSSSPPAHDGAESNRSSENLENRFRELEKRVKGLEQVNNELQEAVEDHKSQITVVNYTLETLIEERKEAVTAVADMREESFSLEEVLDGVPSIQKDIVMLRRDNVKLATAVNQSMEALARHIEQSRSSKRSASTNTVATRRSPLTNGGESKASYSSPKSGEHVRSRDHSSHSHYHNHGHQLQEQHQPHYNDVLLETPPVKILDLFTSNSPRQKSNTKKQSPQPIMASINYNIEQ